MIETIKRRKVVVGILIVLLVVTSLICAYNYLAPKKSVFEIFELKGDSKSVEQLVDANGQSIEVEDYKVTLEQSIYDEKTMMGYLVFAISKEGGKPEVDQVNGLFGKNNQYGIIVEASASSVFAYKGNTLYQYIAFHAAEEERTNKSFICLVDGAKKEYPYQLKSTSDALQYKTKGDSILTISPIGISLKSTAEYKEIEIICHKKDGKKVVLVDTKKEIGIKNSGKHSSGGVDEHYTVWEQFVFKELLDLDQVKSVEFNGDEVTLMK